MSNPGVMRPLSVILSMALWSASLHAEQAPQKEGTNDIRVLESGPRARVNVQSGEPDVVIGVVTSRAFAMSGGATASGIGWEEQCTAPCSFELRPGMRELVFRNQNFAFSREFRLNPGSNNLYLDPGNRGMRIAGNTLAILGLLGLSVGGAILLTRAFLPEKDESGAPNSFREKTKWALPVTIAGGVAMGGGITLSYLGRVKVDEVGSGQARTELMLRAQGSFLVSSFPMGSVPKAALVALMLGATNASAEPSVMDKQAAQSLFDNARKLMQEQNYSEACRLFAQSQKLDPGGGTLLNLAVCHEKLGLLATAYAEFNESLSLAIAAKRTDRQKTASDAIASLAPRLPKLKVLVSDAPAGLQISLGEQPFPREIWGIPTPVDPGKHTLHARAPGFLPVTREVTAREAEVAEISLPRLVPEAPVAPASSAPPPSPPPPPAASSAAPAPSCPPGAFCGDRSRKLEREVSPPLKTLAAVIAITSGVTTVLAGTAAYGLKAAADCSPENRQCASPSDLDQARSARTFAWISTLSLGGVVLGSVAYALIPQRRVQVEFGLGASGATVALGGALP